MKEADIRHLREFATQRQGHSRAISQNERLKAALDKKPGTDSFTIVPPKKSVAPGLSVGAVLEIGRFNKRNTPDGVRQSEQKLIEKIKTNSTTHKARIEDIDKASENLAPSYQTRLGVWTDEITELSELAADPDSNITKKVIEEQLRLYNEFATLPDQLPGLRRGLDELSIDSKVSLSPITKDPHESTRKSRYQTNETLDPPKAPESEKIKVSIQILPDNRIKIGRKVIDANLDTTTLGKIRGKDRVRVLQALVAHGNEQVTSRQLWSEAFGNNEFNRTLLKGIRVWLIKNIVYNNKPIIQFVDKRRHSYYVIPTHEIELSSPKDKKNEHKHQLNHNSGKPEAPFTPKTADEYTSPNGDKFKGRHATLLRIAVENLSRPDASVTVDELVIACGVELNDRRARSHITTQWGQIRQYVLGKLGYEIVSTFDRKVQNEIVRYYRKPTSEGQDHNITDKSNPSDPKTVHPNELSQEYAAIKNVFKFHDESELRGYAAKLLDVVQKYIKTDPNTSISREDASFLVYGSNTDADLVELDRLVSSVNTLLRQRNLGLEILLAQDEEGSERYIKKITAPKSRTSAESLPRQETEREKAKRLIPTIEEAAILAGYFDLRSNIFEHLGLEAIPQYIQEKLEVALDGRNGRSEDDILNLRKVGLEKMEELIRSQLLDGAANLLPEEDPRIDLMVYVLGLEHQQINLGDRALSPLEFMKILLATNLDHVGEFDSHTLQVIGLYGLRIISPTGETILKIDLTETKPATADETVVYDRRDPEADEPTAEAGPTRDIDHITLDELASATTAGIGQEDEPAQPTHEELVAEFLAGEREREPKDPKLIEFFETQIKKWVEILGGLDPKNITIQQAAQRFPILKSPKIDSRDINTGRGKINNPTFTREQIVYKIFELLISGPNPKAKPRRKAFKEAWRKVKIELEKAEAEEAARGDEPKFIEE